MKTRLLLKKLLIILCILCALVGQCGFAGAEDAVSISQVNLTYNGETRDVLYQVIEVEAGIMTMLDFEVVPGNETGGLSYRIYQYNGAAKQKYQLASSNGTRLSVDAGELKSGLPLYLAVYQSGKNVLTRLLTVRVNPSRAQNMVAPQIASSYTENIEVDMSELLPGMKFQMHPYILPITAKAYTDGRVVIGMGINSSNVSFWKSAYNGTLQEKTDVKQLSDAFWGNSAKRSAVPGKSLGLVLEFSGWVQGNIYNTDPMKGEMSEYIPSGFNVSGQYLILTWEVTVTIGADGSFDFELRYNDKNGRYDDFHADSFAVSFKTGLELYGGIGLSSIASVGVYGQGSVAVKDQFYPDPVVQSIVLAGECGFKVKAFSRTLFSYAIVSGSHEFVKDKLTEENGENNSLLGVSELDSVNTALLSSSYAQKSGEIHEPDNAGTWYAGLKRVRGSTKALMEYEADPNFDHLISRNIYPDNRLQVVNTGREDRQMNVIFLGSDGSRTNGNRSRLMNFTFKEADNYLSDPAWVFPDSPEYDVDDTADYDPYVYHNERREKTYMVWRSATGEFEDDASFQDIARNTDVFFTEYQHGAGWSAPSRVTDYASGSSGEFACGFAVSCAADGTPQTVYYTSPVSDPAGVDDTVERTVFFATANGTDWSSEEVCTVTGAVSRVDCAYYKRTPTVAVSYSCIENGLRQYRVEVWQCKDASWNKTFTFEDAMNAQFMASGNGTAVLTWYKDARVFGMLDNADDPRGITPADLKIPSSDYRIYGTYVTGSMAIIGTVSNQSSENAFAIISNCGGSQWGKVDVTDVGSNAIVNEIGMAFTEYDPDDPLSEREPIVFYSVQNYVTNADIDMDYLNGDADALLGAPLRSSFTGLEGSALRIGEGDPRFTDTTADLYVKARKANESVKITDVTFTDEDGARKGKPTPVTVEIENTGMYDIYKLAVFVDDQYVGDYAVNVRAGNKAAIETSAIVPEDAGITSQPFLIRVETLDGMAEDTARGYLGTGHIAVKYSHELRYGNENIKYYVTNNGFAFKTVYACFFDEDTGEQFFKYPLAVPAGTTRHGGKSMISGLYKQAGHQHVRAYVLTEEEARKVTSDMTRDQVEELLDLDSTRSVVINGLDEIYLQDASGAFKSTAFCSGDTSCPLERFTDADPAAWYHDGVHWALERGVMNGVDGDRFAPDGPASRAMLVTMLYRMEGEPGVSERSGFRDVPEGQWYTDAVDWAYANGIVNGYSPETFGPDNDLTREQLAAILERYVKFKGIDVSEGEQAKLDGYSDAEAISDWAVSAFRWAVYAGIVKGVSGTALSPKTNATRAQVATMLMRCDEMVL